MKKYRLYVTWNRQRLFTTTDIEKHQVDKLYRTMNVKFPDVDGYFVGLMMISPRCENDFKIAKFYEQEEK